MMRSAPIAWPDDVDDVLTGDLTAAASYLTPSGGAVVTAVAPCGIDRREDGVVGFTTSLGFGKKLEHIVRDPSVALAYHARDHGSSQSPKFVLVQGTATVDLEPSASRLEAFMPRVEQYLGSIKEGPVWNRLLHEYYWERVFVDIQVTRLVAWPDLTAGGSPAVYGDPLADPPPSQRPPTLGVEPRVDLDDAVRRLVSLTHRVLAYRGADGAPVVVPIELAGHGPTGLELVAPDGLLPPGARRASVLAHSYHPQLVGLSTRSFTGWLEVDENGAAVFAPHTSQGFTAPPRKRVLLVVNGLLAKVGMRRARRQGLLDRLEVLAAERVDATEVSRPAA